MFRYIRKINVNESDLQEELLLLKNEYVQLQDHLWDVELKYQAKLGAGSTAFAANLQKVVASLFNKQLYSDVTILLEGGQQLFGHKLILSARSQNWGEADISQIWRLDMTDARYDVAYTIIQWVYTDELNIQNRDEHFIADLLQTSTQFKLQSLQNRCEKLMISSVNENNCEKYYKIAEEISSEELKQRCLELVCSLEANSEETVNENVQLETVSPDQRKSKQPRQQEQPVPVSTFTTETSYKCSDCNKVFDKSSKLQRHLIVHTDMKPFKCDVCGKAFNKSSSRHRHMILHTGEKPFKCGLCPKAFSDHSARQRHNSTHTDFNRPFKCTSCEKTFPTKCSLGHHMKTHMAEKPFKCDTCSKSFTEKGNLQRHLRLHSGIKPHKCNLCSRAFAEKRNLEQHRRIHTGEKPFKCNICSKSFNQSDSLKGHLRIHSGERPHKCDNCGKTFVSKCNLRTHIRIHTGEKPFKCEICGRAFSDGSHIKRHKLRHNTEGSIKERKTLLSNAGPIQKIIVVQPQDIVYITTDVDVATLVTDGTIEYENQSYNIAVGTNIVSSSLMFKE